MGRNNVVVSRAAMRRAGFKLAVAVAATARHKHLADREHSVPRHRKPRCSRVGIAYKVIGLVGSALWTMHVQAANRFWITPTGGGFGTPGVANVNWSATDGGAGNATAPTTVDIANFTLGNTYDVTFSDDVTNTDLDIENGNVTFVLNGFIYQLTATSGVEVGKVAGQTGRLTITDGDVNLDTALDDVLIGVVDGSTGFLTVGTGGRLGFGGGRPDVSVGAVGNGTLTVQGNGQVYATAFFVGDANTASGSVTVTGPQALLDVSSSTVIGDQGAGTMTLSNGAGFIGGGTASIANGSGGTGTLTITGAGSNWSQAMQMIVGSAGVGTLNVQSSGSLTTAALLIGNGAGSFGTATISGGGSASTQSVTVGNVGTGALTVTGAGSSLSTNGQSVTIGSSGGSEGDVTVSLGGTVTAGAVTLGNFASARGSLKASGSTSTFTSASGVFLIGSAGAGSLEVTSGATVNSVSARIASSAGSRGDVTVSGPGSTWNTGSLAIGGLLGGNGGAGTLTISDGGTVNVSGPTEIRSSVGSSLTIDGGTLVTNNFSRLNNFNFRDGTLHVRGIYDHGAPGAFLVVDGATSDNLPTLRLSGNFAVNNFTSGIFVGNNNQGALVLDGGRSLNAGGNDIFIASGVLSSGTVTLAGAGTTLSTSGTFSVGGSGISAGGTGAVNIGTGATAEAGLLNVYSQGVVNLNGGTLRFATLSPQGGTVNFNAGEVAITTPIILSDSHLDALLGAGHVLGRGQRLSGATSLTFNAPLSLSGGDVVAGTSLTNSSTLQADAGSLTTTNLLTNNAGRLLVIAGTAAVNAGGGITNIGTIQLNDNLVPSSGGALVNNGTIRGSGFIGNSLTNNATGQVQVTAGDRVEFQGATNTNSGSIPLVGGEIVFTGALTNSAGTGLISAGNAILRAGGGITNNGALAVPFGASHLFGDITNAGSVVVSGGASAVFYDDIAQNGTFRVSRLGSTTSTAVVLGAFSGAGGSTGGGDIFFEGDLRPGNSPAIVRFENNIAFGPGATLEIELGGPVAGADYDRIVISQHASLDGDVDVALTNGFVPRPGDQFPFLTAGGTSGSFRGVTSASGSGVQFHIVQRPTSASLFVAGAGDKTWGVDAGGATSLGANWLGGLAPGGQDEFVAFTTMITANRTVTVDAPFTAGTLYFDDDNAYSIGGQAITLDVSAGSARIAVKNTHGAGGHVVAAPLVLNDATVIDVAAGSGLAITAQMTAGAGVGITKSGGGQVAVINVRANALTVAEGTVQVIPDGGAGGVSVVKNLAIATTPPAKLDLANNDLIVDGGNLGLITAMIADGRITSSSANDITTLGVILNGTRYTSFSGQPVSLDDVLVKYTYFGDANLDGRVSIADYLMVDRASARGQVGWVSGDFNYSGGPADGADYFLMDQAFLGQAGPLNGAAMAAAVPEPALAGPGLLGLALLRRARRR